MLKRQLVQHNQPRLSFKPDFIAETVASIDFAYLKSIGITTCFVDLDGTVVGRSTFKVLAATSRALKQSGMDIKIATNRSSSRSLEDLQHQLHASGVIHPRGLFPKPTKHYYQTALTEYGLEPQQVVMIGDRLLQDIFGSNRSGLYSLMVYKVGPSVGAIDRLLSRFEKAVAISLSDSYHKLNGISDQK